MKGCEGASRRRRRDKRKEKENEKEKDMEKDRTKENPFARDSVTTKPSDNHGGRKKKGASHDSRDRVASKRLASDATLDIPSQCNDMRPA